MSKEVEEYIVANSKEMIEPPPASQLSAINLSHLHPHAAQRHIQFLKALSAEVPLDGVKDEDLTAEELVRFKKYHGGIMEWLGKCGKDVGEAALMVYPYRPPTYDMDSFKNLLKTVYERKVTKGRHEAEKKVRLIQLEVERKRREAALKTIAVPVHDAQMYLSNEEQQQFIESVLGATDAFLARDVALEAKYPWFWLSTPSAAAYCYWTGIITRRKDKEAQRRKAKLEYERFVKELGDSITKFKDELSKGQKQNLACPSVLVKYPPVSWCDLALPNKEEIRAWARPQVLARVPQVLVPFVSMVITPQTTVIPRAEYRFLGCPCLTWIFDICVAAQADLHLKASTITRVFYGWNVNNAIYLTCALPPSGH